MKIGFDAKRAFCNSRGLGNYSRNLIDQLCEFFPEDEYILFTPKVNNSILSKWSNGQKLKKILPSSVLLKLLHPLWRSKFILSDIKKSGVDIYHGLSHELPEGIEELSIKKIVTIHDLIFIRYPEYFPWLDRVFYLKKFKHSTRVADLVIAIGEQTKRDIIEYLGVEENKIVIHYQSCHPRFYEIKEKSEVIAVLKKFGLGYKKFIFNVGAFEPRKNQLNLIKAFYEFKQLQQTDQKLVLVGNESSYLKECRSLVNELGLVDDVHFLINIESEVLVHLYQAASLFCFPSYFEGFGIPIIEAMFSRTPVMTSFGSCFPEVAGPESFYIDPYKPKEIARSMVDFYSLPPMEIERRTKLSYEFVQKFTRKNSIEHLHDIYTQLITH